MNDKIIMVTALAAVLVLGVIGLVNVDSNTGAAMVQQRVCHCMLQMVDKQGATHGEPFEKDIRVHSAWQHTEEHCQLVCADLARRDMLVLSATPVGHGTGLHLSDTL